MPRIGIRSASERPRAATLGRVDDRAGDALEWVAARLPTLTSGQVLDLGCGEGRFLPQGAVGLDTDAERLRAARTRSARVVRADARALPFGAGTFDTVYAHRMLNDTGDVDLVLREIVRVLRPRGTLIAFTRARRAEGDRLDRWNGADRLRPYFRAVSAELHPLNERAALFVAERPRPAAGRNGLRTSSIGGRAHGGPAQPAGALTPRSAGSIEPKK